MITTSRYSSPITRKLAREAAKKQNTRYVARGKKTVDALASLARRLGEEEISVYEEENNKFSKIAKIKVKETGEWEWA